MSKTKIDRKPLTISSFVMKLAFVILILGCATSFVMNQVEIAHRKEELASIKSQIEILSEENEEYQRRLNTIDEGEYILRIALEDLGYAFPKERRFYDVSRN